MACFQGIPRGIPWKPSYPQPRAGDRHREFLKPISALDPSIYGARANINPSGQEYDLFREEKVMFCEVRLEDHLEVVLEDHLEVPLAGGLL